MNFLARSQSGMLSMKEIILLSNRGRESSLLIHNKTFHGNCAVTRGKRLSRQPIADKSFVEQDTIKKGRRFFEQYNSHNFVRFCGLFAYDDCRRRGLYEAV